MSTNNDTQDGLPEAEYEILRRRSGKLNIEIMIPGERHPVKHGIKIEDLKKHPDGERACIEERVQRIAARHHDPGDELEEVGPGESGNCCFDPRDREGKPPSERGHGGGGGGDAELDAGSGGGSAD